MADQVTGRPVREPERRSDDSVERTYSYVRAAMVGLLIAIGVAVFHQRMQQGEEPLGSVSAYYYSPAQAVFVGGLIALGVCMIALRGKNPVEEVALNLGGMFAILVAIVPTSRGSDHTEAIAACNVVFDNDKCPDLQALDDATRANVENNIVAILVLGLLGLFSALWLVVRAGQREQRGLSWPGPGFWCGFVGAAAVWLYCLIATRVSIEWFIANAHFTAAAGLLACLFVVAVANAVRRDRDRRLKEAEGRPPEGDGGTTGVTKTLKEAGRTLVKPKNSGRYTVLAWTMVIAGVGGVFVMLIQKRLLGKEVVSLFWVEIIVALTFALFWLVQTIDLEHDRSETTQTANGTQTNEGDPSPQKAGLGQDGLDAEVAGGTPKARTGDEKPAPEAGAATDGISNS